MMTTTQFTKFFATIIFSLFFVTISSAQFTSPLDGDENENIYYFYNESSEGLGDVVSIGQVLQDSGDGAEVTERIRISLMIAKAEECTYIGGCPNTIEINHNLEYSIDGITYLPLIRSSSNPLSPSDWNEVVVVDYTDNYVEDYQEAYTAWKNCDCFLGVCWSECSYIAYNDLQHTDDNGGIRTVYAADEIVTSHLAEPSSPGGFHTVTFDWDNFPKEFLDGMGYFKYSGVEFTQTFEPDFGTPTSVDNLDIENDDMTIDLVGTGGDLPGCHNTENHSIKWFAESSSIYGNTAQYEIDLGDWKAGDFKFPVLDSENSEQLGPDLNLTYKLTYKEYDRGCAIQRIFNDSTDPTEFLDIHTDPLKLIDNLIAQNLPEPNNPNGIADGHVSIEWSHITGLGLENANYSIYRKNSPLEAYKLAFTTVALNTVRQYKNYTLAEMNNTVVTAYTLEDDDNYVHEFSDNYSGLKGRFIDYTAEQDKTYLYKIQVKVNADLHSGTYIDHLVTTGAGINFFNDHDRLNIGTPTPMCGEFKIGGVQDLINSQVRFSNEDYIFNSAQDHKLSFTDVSLDSDNIGTSVQPQRVYFYNDPTLSDIVQIDGDPLVISGSQTEIDDFILPLPDIEESVTMYAIISATRTDGKIFRSFESTEILGMRRPTPKIVNLTSVSFEEYVTLRFSDIKNENSIQDIKIIRTSTIPSEGDPLIDEDITYSEEIISEQIMLDQQYINNMIIESGNLVFYDDADADEAITWSKTILCNEYTYKIQSSNCENWSEDDALPLTFTEVIGSALEETPTLQQDLFEEGNPQRNLSVSKGEYSDKVHLTWNNNSSGVVDHYTVERRQFGFIGETAWIEIGAVSTGEKYFQDEYAEANLLYEYRIKAHVGNCASTSPTDPGTQASTVSSNVIGFRRPVGRVTGRVIYDATSNPVEDVYVKVMPIINEDQTTNRSLDLTSSFGSVDQPFIGLESNQLESYSVGFWIKPLSNEPGVLFSRYSDRHQDIFFDNNQVRYQEYATSNGDAEDFINLKETPLEWNHITMTVSDSVKFYVNGVLSGTYLSTFNHEDPLNDLIFGANSDKVSESFDGLMDEIVVYKRVLSADEIFSNYFKFSSTSDNDLVLFISCDEGLGNMSFDVSSNLIDVFNKNHLSLHETGATENTNFVQNYSNPEGVDYFFSTEVNQELLNLGKTTSSGMYDITDIRYIFDGNNFSITPYTIAADYDVTHQFMPSQRTTFIGDQMMLIPAIDFQDLTSKTVQGKVLFDVTAQTTSKFATDGVTIIDGIDLIDKEIDPIGVADVFVKLNGKRVQADSGELKTDADGQFTLSVPIGNQCISFEKNGFTFYYENDLSLDQSLRGKYCQEFSFSSNGALPDFSCNTYKELRGRVSGGNIFNNQLIDDIIIGFDKPANTIGSVGFTILPNNATVNGYDGYSASVQTDPITGEYSAFLLPIDHKINSGSWISSNKSVQDFYQDNQFLFPTISMKVEGANDANGDFVEDLLTSSNGTIVLETIEYNSRFDITYRNSPSILVNQNISTTQKWTESIGEEFVEIDQDFYMTAYDNTGYALGIPVFKERYPDQTYRYTLVVSEVYSNYGPILPDHDHNSYMYKNQDGESVYSTEKYLNPLSEGMLSINNTMLENSSEVINIADLNSSIDYEFNPDNPYVFGVEEDFLRKFIIEFQEGTITAKWPDLLPGQGEAERGNVLLLGDDSYGNDFFTFGPQSVDMILRDPSGDASFSKITEGSTITRTTSVRNVNGYSKDWEFKVAAGVKVVSAVGFSLGAHNEFGINIQAYLTADNANSISLTNTNENEITISDTYSDAITTNGADWGVGAEGDIFLGESKNLNFGTEKDLTFIASSKCALGGPFTCIDNYIIKETRTFKQRYLQPDEGDLIYLHEFEVDATYEVVQDEFEDLVIIVQEETNSDSGVELLVREMQSLTSYKVGTQTKTNIEPGTSTKFAFTQNYIEDYLIANLLIIKNTYLFGEYNPDTLMLPRSHACFGEPNNSPCFDSIPDKRNYYEVPITESSQTYEIPNLTNYDLNTITQILGSTYSEFQDGFNTLGTNLISPSPGVQLLFPGMSSVADLKSFLSVVSTGPTFGNVENYQEDTEIESVLSEFASNQDFTSVPGFIDLSSFINNLTLDTPESAVDNIIIPRDKVQFYSQQIRLWKRAMAKNELDKIQSSFITNHSISAGISVDQSHTTSADYGNSTSISYQVQEIQGVGADVEAEVLVGGIVTSFSYNENFNVEYYSSSSVNAETYTTTEYHLSDDDQGDILSIDVGESIYGFGPIFTLQAGATSCPWEGAINVKYIKDFDYYFELMFYSAFTDAFTMPANLSFNPVTFDFVYQGELDPGGYENGIKKATWADYLEIQAKIDLTMYETQRNFVYNAVKETLEQEHTELFGASAEFELSATSSQRDKPTLSAYPYNLYNVPEQQQAVFNLALGNESDDNSNRIFRIGVVESTNPDGAIILIDGLNPNREYPVPANGIVNKTLTIQKGPDSLNYEDIQLIIYPQCQYDQGTSDEFHIADTISLSVYFLPTCTDLTISDNDDDWLVNLSDSNVVSLKLNNYDVNYYSFEGVYLDYKFENEDWTPIEPKPTIVNPNYVIKELEYFKKLTSLELYNLLHSDFDITKFDENELYSQLEPEKFCVGCDFAIYEPTGVQTNENWILWIEGVNTKTTYIIDLISQLKETHLSSEFANSDNEMLSLRTSSTNLLWNVPVLPKDGNYQIRAKSNCGSYTSETSGVMEYISVYSSTHDVFSDRIRPELFGSIQPSDGILNPNDDIIIAFNETINEIAFNTSSAQTYVEVESSKNRTTHTDDSYLYFEANDSLVIPSGVYLNQSFTIEMWLKPESNGVLFEQSNGEDSEVIKLSIVDYDSNPKLKFEYIHPSDVDKSQTVSHSMAISSSGFTHIAVAYDAENHEVIFLDGTGEINVPEYDFNMDYTNDGSIVVGKSYTGAMHDLRLWNKIAQNIEANRSISLSGNEANLVGYWPMDDLLLNPKDKARYRHAHTSAQWAVDSDNISLVLIPVLDGSTEFIPLFSEEPIGIPNTSDFTIEFWFNSENAQDQTIISLGSWDDGSKLESWSLDLNSGLVQIYQGGEDNANPILSSFNSFNDGVWHHFAMVKNSSSNTRLYLDGLEIDDVSSDLVGGITAASTFFGFRKAVNFANASVDYLNHFNGYIDEIRVWNIAKSNDRIISEMNSNITDKIGLLSSSHFNDFPIENIPLSDSNVPLIRDSESKTSVSFQDVSNGNQISIQINDSLNMIENTSLDFTIQNIKDESGNYIENPISWSTFIDKNQLIWQNQSIQQEKLLGEALTFSTFIINQGGTVENFHITNLPIWLTANPSEGLLEPNSFALVEFVVNEDLFIGDYYEDILLVGNNNYGERLEFSLNVEMAQPEYSIDEQDFEYVMNFVGKVSVDGIRSRDDKDILFAYVNDELRGASSPIYIEEYDSYFTFLSVYGNQVTGEELSFRLWDASEGKFQSRVKINGQDTYDFQPSFVIGSFTDLAHFEATNILRQEITLDEGWNWLSFNLNSMDEEDDLDHVLQIPTVMSEVNGSLVSIFKNQSAFTQYAELDGFQNMWIGSLNELPVTDMYMIKSQVADTIIYEGKIINPSEVIIDIGIGWNWIGYLGQRIMSTNEALSTLNPSPGDVIKNKSTFSMFASESLGWLGTLNSMESGEGYMLKTENAGSLIYPESSVFRVHDFKLSENQAADNLIPVNASFYEHSMSVVAKIDLEEYNQPNMANVLAAFSNELCIGNITATPIGEDESLYFITIYGEEGYDVSFKYYDQAKEVYFTTENNIAFESNRLIGSVLNPYPITLRTPVGDITNSFSIYPNPFKDEFEIEFLLENQDYITIDIYDVVGRKVSSLYEGLFDPGLHKIKIDAADIAKGSYFIDLKLKDSSIRKTIIKS